LPQFAVDFRRGGHWCPGRVAERLAILLSMGKGRDKLGWERLADVQVPRGMAWVIVTVLWWRQRKTNQAIDELPTEEFGQLLGERWREGTEREEQLVELQASIERMTRWLVRLTIVLGIIGISGIAATIWATVG
jgi:hypothetical protein